MEQGKVWALVALLVGIAIVPLASANHLGANGGCNLARSQMVLGGAIPGVGQPGGPFSQCHNQVYCLLQRECLFEITIKVTGVGLVDARIIPYDENQNTPVICELTPGECVLTYSSAKAFDLHFDCGVGPRTTAVNIVVTCDAHWVA